MKKWIFLGMLLASFQAAFALEVDFEWSLPARWQPETFETALLRSSSDVPRQQTFSKLLLLPDGYEVESYRILAEDWQTLEKNLGARIAPVDSSGEPMLTRSHVNVASGRMMGYEVALVTVYPFRKTGDALEILKHCSLKLSLVPNESHLEVMRRSYRAQAEVSRALELLTGEEPEARWSLELPTSTVTEQPSPHGSVIDCVIVTPDSLRQQFDRIANFHNSLGIRTIVKDIDWILTNYDGVDEAARLRNFLKDAYQSWGTIYFLFGGDPSLVPMRLLDYPSMRSLIGVSSIATDVYYTNLDGTWNADGDETIGEFGPSEHDEPDRFPDVFVGRAPVKSLAEARVFVDKTLHYMRGENPGVWCRTVVSLAQQLFEYLDGATFSEQLLEEFPQNFRKIRIYENFEDYPGSIEENATNALAYIDSGCNIVSHIGHGDELRLDLGTEFLERFQIASLSNDTAFCFIYMMNCSSSDPRVESVAKAFLKDPDGGAFAVQGNSALAFPSTGLPMEQDFFRLIFSEGRPSVGVVSSIYRVPYLWGDDVVRWWMYLNYILDGDPVVRLWVDEPGEFEVVHGGSLSVGDSLVVVEVRDGGVGVEGAVVVLEGGYGEYGVGVSGVGGIAEVGFRPLGVGVVRMYVSGDGYRVYEDSLEVVGGGRCYVSSVEVDDGDGWVGNGDGVAGWGERVGLGVGLRNGGVGDIGGVWGKLREVEGCSLWVYVEIDSGVVDSLVNIGSGSRHPDGNPFGLGVERWVMGRGLGGVGEEVGCWIWLDGMGWHVRFVGDGGEHAYRCSLGVYGGMVGVSGYGLEVGDSLVVDVGVSISGGLGVGDYEDGIDMEVGLGGMVEVLVDSVYYGVVGGSEEVGWYEVGFDSVGGMDGVGVWFELEMGDSIGSRWSDWVWVEVEDGELVLERLRYDGGGDSLGLYCGVRNVGGGGLVGVEGRLRGLWGVEVLDSVSWYGDIGGGSYSEGDGYGVREYGDSVRYELELVDGYGRRWLDTLGVRDVGVVSGLVGEVGSDYVDLSWGCSDSLVDGYDIYRSDDYSGGYSLVGMVDGYRRYKDVGLVSEEDYYYYVEGRDGDGNLSEPSETLCVWTGSPQLPGFPIELRGAAFPSPVAGDATHDGNKEIFIGSKGLEVSGFTKDGKLLDGFPYEGECEIWSSPILVDLDGDGTLECIFGEGKGNHRPNCARLVALNHDGSFVSPTNNPRLASSAPGWPQEVLKLIRSSPVAYDLDGDDHPEIMIGIEPNPPGGETYPFYIFAYDGSGYLESGPEFGQVEGGIWATPAVCDLDSDGSCEIIVCDKRGNLYIWRATGEPYLGDSTAVVARTNSIFLASPAVGDIDGDGKPEIVCVNTKGEVYAWNNDGSSVGGQSVLVSFGDFTQSSPALADFDSDGSLEIVFGVGSDDGSLILIRGDGTSYSDSSRILCWNWPLGSTSPAVGDIDNDGFLEIVTCSEHGDVIAVNEDGSSVNGFPRRIASYIYSSPMIDDLDGDGDIEIAVGGYDSRLHVWDLKAPYDPSKLPWPMFHHDRWHTGCYGFEPPGDTRGPSFTIAMFANPAVERSVDIYVVADEGLGGSPRIEAKKGSSTVLEVTQVVEKPPVYRAHYVLAQAMAETIYVEASDIYGNPGSAQRIITHSQLHGNMLVATSWDSLVIARVARSDALDEIVIMPIDVTYFGKSRDVQMLPSGYNVAKFGENCRLDLLVKNPPGYKLFRYEGKWEPVEDQHLVSGWLVAETEPGIFALGMGDVSSHALDMKLVGSNPFSDICRLRLSVAQKSELDLRVYDVRGRLVRSIYSGKIEGEVNLVWDGSDDSGHRVSSGIYFIRGKAGEEATTAKVILVR